MNSNPSISSSTPEVSNLTLLTKDSDVNLFVSSPLKLKIDNLYMYVIDYSTTIFVYKDEKGLFALPYPPYLINPNINYDIKIDWDEDDREKRRITDETFKGLTVTILKISSFKINLNWSELLFMPFVFDRDKDHYGLMIYQQDCYGKMHELLPREFRRGNILLPQMNTLEHRYIERNGSKIRVFIQLNPIRHKILNQFDKYMDRYSPYCHPTFDINEDFFNMIYQKKNKR